MGLQRGFLLRTGANVGNETGRGVLGLLGPCGVLGLLGAKAGIEAGKEVVE